MAKPPKDAKGSNSGTPVERRNRVRPVGDLLPEVGGTAFRRFGFLQGALLTRWREVVGPVYARWSVPQSIRFPRGSRLGGTLIVRAQGPFALQLQHVAPQLIERANRILGAGVISELKLVQGDVPPPEPAPSAPSQPQGPAAGATNLSGVADPELRRALESLSAALAHTRGPPRIG